MPSSRDRQLARLSAETRRHIVKANASNADSTEHVRCSRDAVGRSLRLLAETAATARRG